MLNKNFNYYQQDDIVKPFEFEIFIKEMFIAFAD